MYLVPRSRAIWSAPPGERSARGIDQHRGVVNDNPSAGGPATWRHGLLKWVLARLRFGRQRIEELVDLLHIGVVELVMGLFGSDRRQRLVPDLRVVRHDSGNARGRGSGSRCFFRTDRGLGGEVEKREH